MPENMPPLVDSLSPSQRLELSRRALLETMHPGSTRKASASAVQARTDALEQAEDIPSPELTHVSTLVPPPAGDPLDASTRAPDVQGAMAEQGMPSRLRPARRPARRMVDFSRLVDSDTAQALSTGAMALQRLVNAWWSRHPLHVVADIGEPLAQKYARRHPYRLLAIAAAVGAAVVVLKPWRWTGTRRWARSTLSREVQSMNFSRLSQMVVDSLLHNGKP